VLFLPFVTLPADSTDINAAATKKPIDGLAMLLLAASQHTRVLPLAASLSRKPERLRIVIAAALPPNYWPSRAVQQSLSVIS
jgi:hypothetical protein